MALLWMDGFDHFANINSTAATSSALSTADYVTSTTGADGLRVMPGRVPDSFAVRLNQSGGISGTLKRTFESEGDVVVIGFAYMATERSNIIGIEGTPLVLEWPVGCKLNGVEGEAIPIRNIWYYFELVINKPADVVQLYINNRLDITAPMPAEFVNMTTYTLRWGKEITGTDVTMQFIDDLVIIDDTGIVGDNITSRIGPVEITTRFPTEDVTTEWVPSIEGPLFDMVNNRPPEAGKYIQSNISEKEATFLSDTELPSDAPIFAIGVVARALKTDIDRRALGLIWGEGANRLEVIDSTLSTDNTYSYGFFESPPSGGSWSKEVVEDTPFGVKVRP